MSLETPNTDALFSVGRVGEAKLPNHFRIVLEAAKTIGNNDDARLQAIAQSGNLPNSVTPEKIREYLRAVIDEKDFPPFAVATAMAVMGYDFKDIGDEGKRQIRDSVKVERVKGRFHGEEIFWSDMLLGDFRGAANFYYNYYESPRKKDLAAEDISGILGKAIKEDDRWETPHETEITSNFRRLISLGFTPASGFLDALSAISNEPRIHRLIFALQNPFPEKINTEENPAHMQKALSKLLKKAITVGICEENQRSVAVISTGYYEPILRDLLVVAHRKNALFGAFGQDSAQGLIDILQFDDSVLASENVAVLEKVIIPIFQLERHWRELTKTWAQVSVLPMNPPVLEHRGFVLDRYGRLDRDFITRMFMQRDTDTGKAYSDIERQGYTKMMCEKIAGGMSLTGIDRIEWDFWSEVMKRIEAENNSQVVHVDCGGSTGFVTRQLWTDERTGGRKLVGRLAQVINMDLIPESATLDRVYQFDSTQYDRTERLLSRDEANAAYHQAQEDFTLIHPSTHYINIKADTSSPQLPSDMEQLKGHAHLVTNMRAQFLHGRSEDRQNAHRLHQELINSNENARIYEQRGIPIYGDLILGVLYKMVKGKLEIEALQVNDHGKSATLWRLDENGQLNQEWEGKLRQLFEK